MDGLNWFKRWEKRNTHLAFESRKKASESVELRVGGPWGKAFHRKICWNLCPLLQELKSYSWIAKLHSSIGNNPNTGVGFRFEGFCTKRGLHEVAPWLYRIIRQRPTFAAIGNEPTFGLHLHKRCQLIMATNHLPGADKAFIDGVYVIGFNKKLTTDSTGHSLDLPFATYVAITCKEQHLFGEAGKA